MSNKKRIVLSGYYGFDNIGDEAILQYLIELLKSNDITPVVVTANPNKTSKQYDVEAVDRFNFTDVMKVVAASDGLISGGGSLLQDSTSKKSVIYYLMVMSIAYNKKKPVFFYGQGIGPIKSKVLRFLSKKILTRTEVMSVRDKESKEFLERKILLPKTKEIEVIHDPVLFYEKNEISNGATFSPDELSFLNQQPIFISIRPTENDETVIAAFQRYLVYLNEQKIPVISFPFHSSQDTDITKTILNASSNSLFIERSLTLEEIAFVLSKSRLVVGLRLHSLILAASQGTPFVAVSYDPKIDSFVKQFDYEPVGNIHTVTEKLLIQRTQEILTSSDKIKKHLLDSIYEMKEHNNRFNEKITKIING